MSNKVLQAKNQAAIQNLRNKPTRLVRNGLFISVSLTVADKKSLDGTYKERVMSHKIVTAIGLIPLSELADDTAINFTIAIESPANKAEFTHNALKENNGVEFFSDNSYKIAYDGTLESLPETIEFLGQEFSNKDLQAWIKIHLGKQGATQQWKKAKGQYITL